MAGVVKVGPWGGNGGHPEDVGPASHIQSIHIRSGGVVDRVTVEFVVDGKVFTISMGGDGGDESRIDLDVDEHLTSMSGSVNVYEGYTVVAQLSLTTNKGKVHGPYGKGGGTAFSLPVADGKITNFFGSGGGFVDSLGAYLAPI